FLLGTFTRLFNLRRLRFFLGLLFFRLRFLLHFLRLFFRWWRWRWFFLLPFHPQLGEPLGHFLFGKAILLDAWWRLDQDDQQQAAQCQDDQDGPLAQAITGQGIPRQGAVYGQRQRLLVVMIGGRHSVSSASGVRSTAKEILLYSVWVALTMTLRI